MSTIEQYVEIQGILGEARDRLTKRLYDCFKQSNQDLNTLKIFEGQLGRLLDNASTYVADEGPIMTEYSRDDGEVVITSSGHTIKIVVDQFIGNEYKLPQITIRKVKG